MSQRRNGAAPEGAKESKGDGKDLKVSDKQVKLLSQDAGHFSLVRALHLADFITELNGTFRPCLHTLYISSMA
ncbi:hypothetical protein NX059_003175 [Plenodomus lindquistii]|nr:hypothetical protein NX059_003175 [Plenodomus lindquistii]